MAASLFSRRPLLLLLAMLCLVGPSRAQDGYQVPPPALAQLVEAPLTPGVDVSPDGRYLLLSARSDLPVVADLAQPELRLAGLRINPRNNSASRGGYSVGLRLRSLADGAERPVTGLPAAPRIQEIRWAPDGRRFAFTLLDEERVELWVADAATARARRLLDAPLNPLGGRTYDWLSDGRGLVAQLLPAGRGPVPAEPQAPGGPVVQENLGKIAPARTYQDLLEDAHDEALFEHYLTSQLVHVTLDGQATPLGAPGLVTSMEASPDGRYVLVERRHRPFSYLVPWYRFPNRIEVLDLQGRVVHEVADLPLMEEVPIARGATTVGPRSVGWRADAPATLVWAEAQDEGNPKVEVDVRDRVYLLPAPFTGRPVELAALPLRYGGVTWGRDDLALVSEYWPETRRLRTYVVAPARPASAPRLLFDHSYEDRYNDPGDPMTRLTPQGTRVLLTTDDGRAIYVSGSGASPEGDRPYVARLNLDTGAREELFRAEAPYYERPLQFIAADRLHLLTLRESVTTPPNYFLRDLRDGGLRQLTDFPHPYPELAGIQKEFIVYERADGVQLDATLYLPAGYDRERDGPLPAIIWAYPREFKSADAAGQVSDSPYRFARVSYWGAVPFVTQGYAVLDNASMPVIGEGAVEPNDTFIDQLVMNARAAIDEGVRRGVVDPARVGLGGHSYGAFMTANLLAHSDLFRAGAARSGAYNRTLTPFGFQNEARTFWEAPEIYFAMSPFMHAHEIDEPLLLVHGAADNNPGTFPMQSERLYNALKGHGRTARLVMLPYESHGYAARESLLHMLWEMNRWFDQYVKHAPPREAAPVEVETSAGG